ncbi:hypothetical protein J7K99_03345, partial [bacterium]|nr:hypothetical protein [bacterium]
VAFNSKSDIAKLAIKFSIGFGVILLILTLVVKIIWQTDETWLDILGEVFLASVFGGILVYIISWHHWSKRQKEQSN